ncbi:unnamed protein product [Heligmosomoides polygyrus]|uniref:ZP domain-containing protein n=1 Tax=Heligmosomoides polygyrus TaxID=6339 RepID=A0A183GDJ2_HELPZ|nr:unnamed protein product [Heligmosomoides polygyrus]
MTVLLSPTTSAIPYSTYVCDDYKQQPGTDILKDWPRRGQLYTALCRVRQPDGILVKSNSNFVKNVVFSEVFA